MDRGVEETDQGRRLWHGPAGNKQLYTDQTIYSLMVNSGATELYNADGTVRFNNPQTVAAYQEYANLYKFLGARRRELDLG